MKEAVQCTSKVSWGCRITDHGWLIYIYWDRLYEGRQLVTTSSIQPHSTLQSDEKRSPTCFVLNARTNAGAFESYPFSSLWCCNLPVIQLFFFIFAMSSGVSPYSGKCSQQMCVCHVVAIKSVDESSVYISQEKNHSNCLCPMRPGQRPKTSF